MRDLGKNPGCSCLPILLSSLYLIPRLQSGLCRPRHQQLPACPSFKFVSGSQVCAAVTLTAVSPSLFLVCLWTMASIRSMQAAVPTAVAQWLQQGWSHAASESRFHWALSGWTNSTVSTGSDLGFSTLRGVSTLNSSCKKGPCTPPSTRRHFPPSPTALTEVLGRIPMCDPLMTSGHILKVRPWFKQYSSLHTPFPQHSGQRQSELCESKTLSCNSPRPAPSEKKKKQTCSVSC